MLVPRFHAEHALSCDAAGKFLKIHRDAPRCHSFKLRCSHAGRPQFAQFCIHANGDKGHGSASSVTQLSRCQQMANIGCQLLQCENNVKASSAEPAALRRWWSCPSWTSLTELRERTELRPARRHGQIPAHVNMQTYGLCVQTHKRASLLHALTGG